MSITFYIFSFSFLNLSFIIMHYLLYFKNPIYRISSINGTSQFRGSAAALRCIFKRFIRENCSNTGGGETLQWGMAGYLKKVPSETPSPRDAGMKVIDSGQLWPFYTGWPYIVIWINAQKMTYHYYMAISKHQKGELNMQLLSSIYMI